MVQANPQPLTKKIMLGSQMQFKNGAVGNTMKEVAETEWIIYAFGPQR